MLRWEFGLLYLDRYWQQEVALCRDLLRAGRAGSVRRSTCRLLEAGLDRVFGEPTYAEQRAASDRAARQWLTVLTGGPGRARRPPWPVCSRCLRSRRPAECGSR